MLNLPIDIYTSVELLKQQAVQLPLTLGLLLLWYRGIVAITTSHPSNRNVKYDE